MSDIVRMLRHPRYVGLVLSFPVLEHNAPGVSLEGIDLDLLDRWASHDKDPESIKRILDASRGPFPGDGAVEAARFVLNVWSSRHEWRCGRFDIFRAVRVWDHQQLNAFQQWADFPFRP